MKLPLSSLRWVAALGLLLSSSGCEKDFLDINQDPNNPGTADISLVLPSGQGNVSFIVGGQYNVLGEILAQHLGAGTQQFRNYDQYNINSGTLDGREFQGLYAGALNDFEYVIREGTKQEEFRMVGIAKILKAHTYQVLTDLYGDLPFSQALQPELTTTPAYDRQSDIYAGLHTLLNEGIADIRKRRGRFPSTADMNYRASSEVDMEKWVRLANTLRLKLSIRASEVPSAASRDSVQKLYSQVGANGFMLAGEDFQFANNTAANTENPFYQINFRLPNSFAVSRTLGTFFFSPYADPRVGAYIVDYNLNDAPLTAFFKPPGSPDNFSWSRPGTWFIGQNFSNGSDGKPGRDFPGIPATDNPAKARPTLLLTYEESLFLRAEAATRGWTAEVAQTLYNNGVGFAMTRYNVPVANINNYLAYSVISFANAPTVEAKIARIARQKWLALFGTNGLEAWAEARRTDGYTTLNNVGVQQPGIPLVLPQVNTLGNRFIKRLPYPDSELQRNPNVASTGLAPGDVTTPVWWDVN